jgi:hypothetical protein
MMYWGCFACGGGEEIQEEAGQTATSRTCLDRLSNRLTKNPQRRAQTQHAMRMGRDWPVKPVIRPEQCQALGKNLPLADFPLLIQALCS